MIFISLFNNIFFLHEIFKILMNFFIFSLNFLKIFMNSYFIIKNILIFSSGFRVSEYNILVD